MIERWGRGRGVDLVLAAKDRMALEDWQPEKVEEEHK
jgi:hypothetical protein